MSRSSFRRAFPLTVLTVTVAGAAIPAARGQFNGNGSATISTAVTTPQTLGTSTSTNAAGTITNTGSITVSSTSVPLTISGTGTTLDNSGRIENTNAGASGNPRALLADGTNLLITNQVGGLIQTAGNDAVRSSNAATSITFTNRGSVIALNTSTSAPQQAVDWNSILTGANTFNNYGTVQATGNDALRPGVNGVINNFANATVTSANTTLAAAIAAGNGLSSDGIDAQTNSGVQVTNSGRIEGARHGITGGLTTGTGAYTMSVTNNVGGVIQGTNGAGLNLDGINANEVVTIVNRATITGNGSALTGANTVQDGDGVDVDGVVNLTNSGTIRSINALGDTSEGVTVGGGTINNQAGGLIEGNVAAGNTSGATGKGINVLGIDTVSPIAAMYANTVITNDGTIRGQTNSAITIGVGAGGPSGFTATITNNAGGLIEGGGATAAAIQTGADNDTVNNSGRIVANASGLAIDLGAGNNAVNLLGGTASIVGNVSGGIGGTNTLTISPGAGNGFTYAGSFSNFNSVQVNAGTVTLSGNSTYTGATTVANGGTLVAANAVATGNSATGTGAVTVQSGGTLAGNGRIGGPSVTLESGALLSPSSRGALAPGRLTLGGDLNVTGGSRFAFALGSTAAGSDSLAVGGALNFTGGNGPLVFDVLDAGGLTTGRYDLIDFASTNGLTLANLSFGTTPAGFTGTFDLSGTSLSLTVTTVPEPGTLSVFLGGALALGGAMVRRRQR